MQAVKIGAGALALLVILAVFLKWTAGHDTKVMQAAAKYEQCIIAEYRTTPAQWYAEHGSYPECSSN